MDRNRVALVTGASRGIGRAVAAACAAGGMHVGVNYRSDREAAAEVVAGIVNEGGRACAFQADLSRMSDVELLFDKVIERFGGLDVLVNNAGIMINTPVADVAEEEFDRIFATNVKGVFFCCREAARRLRDNGVVINIGSTVTKLMLPHYATYAMSKGAVEQLTRVLAKELGPRGIRVNTVSPGPTDTELFRSGKSEERIEAMASMSPFNRLGQPQDIGRAVAMLCSEEAAWISGQTILVNGACAA